MRVSTPPGLSRFSGRRTFTLLLTCGVFCAFSPDLGAEPQWREVLEALEYKVRVRVINDARRVKLAPRGPFRILDSAGRECYRSQAPAYVKFEVPETLQRPAGHRVVVGAFDHNQKIPAVLFSRKVQRHIQARQGVEAIPVTSQLLQYPDFRPYEGKTIVTVGHFLERAEAERWAEKLKILDVETQLISDPRPVARAVIRISLVPLGEITGAGGETTGPVTVVGEFPDNVKLVQEGEEGQAYLEPLQTERSVWWRTKPKDRTMRGDFELWINRYGRLQVANELPVDDYLYGVVEKEMGDFAPDEALRAQAIASRTFALHRVVSGRYFYDRYDLTDEQYTTMEYEGSRKETDRVVEAVDRTRGEVLLRDDELIDALFAQNCGGVTAGAGELWFETPLPYLVPVYDRRFWTHSPNLSSERAATSWLSSMPDVFCNSEQRGFPAYARKYFRWQRTLSVGELETAANRDQHVESLRDVRVRRRSASGRVQALELVGERATITLGNDMKIRRALGSVASTLFYLDKTYAADGKLKRLTVYGGGFGHGAGMCQMGALMMAKRGYRSQDILRHYFHGVKIKRIY